MTHLKRTALALACAFAASSAAASSFTISTGFEITLDSAKISGTATDAVEGVDYDNFDGFDPFGDSFSDLAVFGGATGADTSDISGPGAAPVSEMSATLEGSGEAFASGDEVFFDGFAEAFWDFENIGTSAIDLTFSFEVFGDIVLGPDPFSGGFGFAGLFVESEFDGFLFETVVEIFDEEFPGAPPAPFPIIPSDVDVGTESFTLDPGDTLLITLEAGAFAGASIDPPVFVPLPMTGLMAISGLGALTLLRRRS